MTLYIDVKNNDKVYTNVYKDVKKITLEYFPKGLYKNAWITFSNDMHIMTTLHNFDEIRIKEEQDEVHYPIR